MNDDLRRGAAASAESTSGACQRSCDAVRLVFSVHQLGEKPDVADSHSERVDLRQALLVRKCRDVRSQAFERFVDRLHSLPLALIRRMPLLLLLVAFPLPVPSSIYFRLIAAGTEDDVVVLVVLVVAGGRGDAATTTRGIKLFPVLSIIGDCTGTGSRERAAAVVARPTVAISVAVWRTRLELLAGHVTSTTDRQTGSSNDIIRGRACAAGAAAEVGHFGRRVAPLSSHVVVTTAHVRR